MKRLKQFIQRWLGNTRQSSKQIGQKFETYLFTPALLGSSSKFKQNGATWGRYKSTQLQKVMDMAG